MPMYEYHCDICNIEFQKYVRTHLQAACKKAMPNSARAYCPVCNTISMRTFNTPNLYIFNPHRVINQLKAIGDKAHEGKRLTVDAGFDYGAGLQAAAEIGGVNITKKTNEEDYTFDSTTDCDCEFCSPQQNIDDVRCYKDRGPNFERIELGRGGRRYRVRIVK